MTTLASLAAGKYLSLTTFRQDGTPVATPVWLVRDGESLRIITEINSGKAKRLRRSNRVLVAACDMRGRLHSEPVEATATLQDPEESARTATMVRERYGLVGRLLMMRADRAAKKAGAPTQVGITVTIG